jgi:hypothetical protein
MCGPHYDENGEEFFFYMVVMQPKEEANARNAEGP